MKYTNCPLCERNVSINTFERNGKCNDCTSKELIEDLLQLAKSNEVFIQEWKNEYIYGYGCFISKSKFGNVWKYRALIDFKKILHSQNENIFSEKIVEDTYYKISRYKSPKTIETIIIFLFSSDCLMLDKSLFPWAKTNLKSSYYYLPTILEYYFDNNRCADCGKDIGKQTHRYCYNCLGRRSLINTCHQIEADGEFINNDVRSLYKSFLNFLFDSRLNYSYIDDLSDIELLIFKQLDSDFKNSTKTKILSISFNSFQEIITPRWIANVFQKLPVASFSKTKKKLVIAAIGHLVGFFEKEKIIPNGNFSPDVIVENEAIIINLNPTNPYQKIVEKIQEVPKGFRVLLQYYLEIEKNRNEVLEKKNASKSLSWRSINSEFTVFFSLINWLVVNESVSDWTLVSQDTINRYLLSFGNIQNREIQKRKLYNFFEFGRKNRLLIQNPILPFKAKDYPIISRVFTKSDHKNLFKSIKQLSKSNPTDSLLASLCYFNALTSKQIQEIKIDDINLFRKCIHVKGRAPAYLNPHEVQYLNNHIKITDYYRNHYGSPLLFFIVHKGRVSQVSTRWINKHVKNVYSETPHNLRKAGLQYCADKFGPQFLHDCFGLSLSHTARFGNPDDRIIEDLLEDTLSHS